MGRPANPYTLLILPGSQVALPGKLADWNLSAYGVPKGGSRNLRCAAMCVLSLGIKNYGQNTDN
jgi:hypothetical protein